MKAIKFLYLIVISHVFISCACAQSSAQAETDLDIRINQLVKIGVQSEFQTIKEREAINVDKQRKIFEATSNLLEDLHAANRSLASNIEQFQMMLSIANTTSPVGDVGYNLQDRFNNAFNNLIDKKPATDINDTERKRLKSTLSNIVGLMQDNFPAVNVIASALTTFASYTKPVPTGSIFSPQIQNPAIFSEQELVDLRKSFSDDFKFFNDLKNINERYLSLSNQAFLQTQQSIKTLENFRKILLKSISTKTTIATTENINVLKNQYFSSSNSDLGMSASYRFNLAQDSLFMNIEFHETVAIYETMFNQYRLEMEKMYDALVKLDADKAKIEQRKNSLRQTITLSGTWQDRLKSKANDVELALML